MAIRLSERYAQLCFYIDRFGEKERLLSLVAIPFGLLLLWYVAFYIPQTHAINWIKTQTNTKTIETTTLIDKQTHIEQLVHDNTTTQLIVKYEHLKNDMQALDNKFYRYKSRFIDDRHLYSLLYAILQQTPGVSILGLSNRPLPPDPLPSSKPSTLEPMVARTQYTLVLNGSYFAILDYLQKLEQTGWQLYWDQFVYKVNTYPEATATIQFYTLKPILLSGGAA